MSYWRKYVHEVLVNRLGGLSLPRKSVVRLTDRPDMTLDVYVKQQYNNIQRYFEQLGPDLFTVIWYTLRGSCSAIFIFITQMEVNS